MPWAPWGCDGIQNPARVADVREVGLMSARVAGACCGLFDNFVSGAMHFAPADTVGIARGPIIACGTKVRKRSA